MKTDLMIDLETLGTGPLAVVVSVGAAAFSFDDSDTVTDQYRAVLDRDQQEHQFMRERDPSTVAWWEKQSPAARSVFEEPQLEVHEALEGLAQFVGKHCVPQTEVRAWGNGADFDLVILGSLYKDVKLQAPWRYHQQRCFRTLKSLFPREYDAAKRLPSLAGGPVVKHDALADAVWQARVAQELWRAGCLWGRE